MTRHSPANRCIANPESSVYSEIIDLDAGTGFLWTSRHPREGGHPETYPRWTDWIPFRENDVLIRVSPVM